MNTPVRGSWRQMERTEAAAAWNPALSLFPAVSPFQTFEQGAAAEAEGWHPQYWLSEEDGAVSAMVLVLFKRLPLGTGMFWVVGGPSGDFYGCGQALLEALCADNGVRRGYLRIRFDCESVHSDVGAVTGAGLAPSSHPLGSARTVELTLGTDGVASPVSRNWRRSLRKAESNGLAVYRWTSPDPAEMHRILSGVERMKGVSVHFSREKLESCVESLGDVFRVFRCDDSMGRMVAFRAALVFGDRAVDFAAGADADGRHLGASQLLVYTMSMEFAKEGITVYELGGIDPVNNPGVTRFKLESGGREVAQLGEWDAATSAWLRLAANAAIRIREIVRTRRSFGTGRDSRVSLGNPTDVPHIALS